MIESPEQGFLSAILAAPDDIAPRLIYADWLDEHDQPERAKFIRQSFRLLWERYAYGKWRWYHERQGSDGAMYWYPNALEQPRPAWYPANFPLFPKTWRRHLSHVVYRQGFVEELLVDRFHSNVKKLLHDQPVTTITTTAEALLEYVDNFDCTACLRTIRLTTTPPNVSFTRLCLRWRLSFGCMPKPITIPILPSDVGRYLSSVDTGTISYYLGRVFAEFLHPHGITVQLPPIQ